MSPSDGVRPSSDRCWSATKVGRLVVHFLSHFLFEFNLLQIDRDDLSRGESFEANVLPNFEM